MTSISLQRKVQLTGSSTLAVSLPKAWAQRYNIKPQTAVFLRELPDGSLTLSKQAEPQHASEARFETTQFSSPVSLQRAFIAKYLSGCIAFHFQSSRPLSPTHRTAILEQAKGLVGLEVVEESPLHILVQDFFSPRQLSLEKALKRLYHHVSSMQESLSQALEDGETAISSVQRKEEEVDRLRFLVVRLLNGSLNNSRLLVDLKLSTQECLYYADVAHALERMADSIMNAFEHLQNASASSKRMWAPLQKLNHAAYSLQRKALEAFFEKDTDKANEVLEEYGNLKRHQAELGMEMERMKAPFDVRAAAYSIFWIARKSADVAENALDCKYGTS